MIQALKCKCDSWEVDDSHWHVEQRGEEWEEGDAQPDVEVNKRMLNNLHVLKSESDVSTIYIIFSQQPVESVAIALPIMEPLLFPYVSLSPLSHHNVTPFL